MPNINALGSNMKAAAATPASWRNFSTFAPTQSARCGTGYSREVLRRAQAADPQNGDSALIFWGRSAWPTLFSANVSRARRLRALRNDREPIVTEREPEAIPIVSEREPKRTAVCEPGCFRLRAATPTARWGFWIVKAVGKEEVLSCSVWTTKESCERGSEAEGKDTF
jgi:hypothetical protein